MRLISRVISLAFVIIILFSVCASALSDNALWEDSEVYNLFSEGESNCSLNYAVAKVKYDYPSNRIHILFMMSFDSFADKDNAGVEIELNDLGTITLMADGTVEYDDEIFYACVDDVTADSRTASIYIETTIGIKKGIPENLEMKTSVIDTEGIRSNEFSLDISDTDIEETTAKGKEKTTKTKTTKVKTTKAKTTKVKATTVKTTKSKKSSASKTTDKETTKAYATLNNKQMDSRISGNGNGKRAVAIAVIAVAVCFAVAGCIAGIKKTGKSRQ